MASPAFLAACCLGNESIIINNSVPRNHPLLQEVAISIVALVVAITSCLATFLLLYPWRSKPKQLPWKRNRLVQGPNLNHVINCLITSEVLGNLGLIARSGLWIDGLFPGPDDLQYTDFKHVFCVVASLWVEYFYQASVFWHLVYAMEAYMISYGKTRILQHFLGWVVSAAFCALAAWVAYHPLFSNCAVKSSLDKKALYCVSLSPLVIVFLLNVGILSHASSTVKKSLIHHVGTYSATERQIVAAVKLKFTLLMTSYAVCSLPILINGVLVNTLDGRSGDVILVFLVLEAVVNPFQVLLDAMILWEWPPRLYVYLTTSRYTRHKDVIRSRTSSTRSRSRSIGDTASFSNSHTERDPLISFSRDRK